MKRRIVKILNWLTTLSTILCIAMSLLWGRNVFVADRAACTWRPERGPYRDLDGWVDSSCGTITLDFSWATYDLAIDKTDPRLEWKLTRENMDGDYFRQRDIDERDNELPTVLGQLGFQTYRGVGYRGQDVAFVTFPHWSAVAAFAIAPYLRFVIRRRRRARLETATFCQSCGYDLRATPHKYPECGTIPAGDAKGTT